jgi:hypothetical protein
LIPKERAMSRPTPPPAAEVHEPGLGTVEMLCERLGELGLPIGPDTARDILRAVLAMEAPRIDAHVREALQTSIDTIRVAAQSANGVLASTVPVRTRPEPRPVPPKPVLDPPPRRATPPAGPRPAPGRRPIAKRNSDPGEGDDTEGEQRPVFRRPRGR